MVLTFVLIGVAAGILAGLFGIGGGILIVPALVYFGGMAFKTATGTSLGALLLPVGLLAALTYWRAGNLDVRASLLVALGLLFGAWAGARLAQGVPAPTLQRLFAVFLIIVALRMFVKA